MPVTTIDIAWAAGFLEGEGSFTRNDQTTLLVQASQVQREPLDRLQRMFGGTIRYITRSPPKSDYHTWAVYGYRAVGAALTIYSLMSPRRQGQIDHAMLPWRQSGVWWPRGFGRCLKGHNLIEEGKPCPECQRAFRDRRREENKRCSALVRTLADVRVVRGRPYRCACCGSEYTAKTTRQHYCSRLCSGRDNKRRWVIARLEADALTTAAA